MAKDELFTRELEVDGLNQGYLLGKTAKTGSVGWLITAEIGALAITYVTRMTIFLQWQGEYYRPAEDTSAGGGEEQGAEEGAGTWVHEKTR